MKKDRLHNAPSIICVAARVCMARTSHYHFIGFILGAFLSVSPQTIDAQGTMSALNFTPPGALFYASGGVGWSFIPTADLLVTAVSSSAPQVSFWAGTDQVIATYDYAGPYGSLLLGATTNFQSVTPLLLSAGQTYFVSTQFSNFTSQVNFFLFGLGLTSFTNSSYISQFASYSLSTSDQWSPTMTPPGNSDYLLLGPNFQFQVVPEPTSLELLLAAFLSGIFVLRKARPGDILTPPNMRIGCTPPLRIFQKKRGRLSPSAPLRLGVNVYPPICFW
jgi:hypothetical protein